MKIKIKKKYKSIDPFNELELPNYSILTGVNGSGKTHLLEAIADKDTSEVKINNKIIKNIKHIEFNGLMPVITETCDPSIINNYVKKVWNQYLSKLNKSNNNLKKLCKKKNRLTKIFQK